MRRDQIGLTEKARLLMPAVNAGCQKCSRRTGPEPSSSRPRLDRTAVIRPAPLRAGV